MRIKTVCGYSIAFSEGAYNGLIGKDVMNWWKNHAETYPNLSRLARDYLGISATSASSERLFSSGSNLITDKRNRLKDDTNQAHECLKSWIKK